MLGPAAARSASLANLDYITADAVNILFIRVLQIILNHPDRLYTPGLDWASMGVAHPRSPSKQKMEYCCSAKTGIRWILLPRRLVKIEPQKAECYLLWLPALHQSLEESLDLGISMWGKL